MNNPKNILIDGLMHLYPRAWREAYGADLAESLRDHPLTPLVVVDLLRVGLMLRLTTGPRLSWSGVVQSTVGLGVDIARPVRQGYRSWPFAVVACACLGLWVALSASGLGGVDVPLSALFLAWPSLFLLGLVLSLSAHAFWSVGRMSVDWPIDMRLVRLWTRGIIVWIARDVVGVAVVTSIILLSTYLARPMHADSLFDANGWLALGCLCIALTSRRPFVRFVRGVLRYRHVMRFGAAWLWYAMRRDDEILEIVEDRLDMAYERLRGYADNDG